MARNRIRSRNTLQSRHVWQLFAICLGLTLFFLAFVILKVRIDVLSRECSTQEAQLQEIRQKESSLRVQIERRRNPEYLQSKLVELGMGMVEIRGPSFEIVECPMPEEAVVARRPR